MKPFILWLTMVFIISVYPFGAAPAGPEGLDKIFHFVIYSITCALFYSALKGRAVRWPLALSVLLASAYGLLMEMIQHFTGYRSFSGYDALANLLGALAAAVVIWTRVRRRAEG